MNGSSNSTEKKRFPAFLNIIIGILPLLLILGYEIYHHIKNKPEPLSDLISQFSQIQNKDPNAPFIESVLFRTQEYQVTYGDKSSKTKKIKSYYALPGDDQSKIRQTIDTINQQLDPVKGTKKITYRVEEFSDFNWKTIILNLVPMVAIMLGLLWFLRKMQRGGSGLMVGKQRNISHLPADQKVTFSDIAGVDESKEELIEIVDFLKNPSKYLKLGAKIPKGILLTGLPGTGKTLLAKAIAGEANVPFYSVSGSEFEEILVGLGASRIRELFDEAKKHAPSIVFIDEIDSIGKQRGYNKFSANSEQTLNQLLVELDGFDTNSGVIIIAATNRSDVLDPALLRPGRFDRHVYVPPPDVKGREEILKVHSKKIPLTQDVDLSLLARSTPGFSGAELAALLNEAVIIAAKKNLSAVGNKEIESATQKITMGPERRSLVLSEQVRQMTAYHEAGHVIVAHFTPGLDPVNLVTIIPRTNALGLTQQLPIEDRLNVTKQWVLGTIGVFMGGRAAEEIVFNHITTGSQDDLEKATLYARKMVCQWGMSDAVGPLNLSVTGKDAPSSFTGEFDHYSDKTAQLIDSEIKTILENQYHLSKNLIQAHRNLLDKLAQELLSKETLHADDIRTILG